MTPEQALEKTSKEFTNLIDGSLLPGATVEKVIEYYNSCLADISTSKFDVSYFEDNFFNEMCQEIENDYHDQFGNDFFSL